jgi:hypothetical protein
MHFSSNQSAVHTGYPSLTSLLQPATSHVIIETQPTGEVNWCASICCHASSSQFCHAYHPLRKGDVRTHFPKDKRDAIWPFTTSHKNVAVRIQHCPLSHVARSCRTTRHSPFLAPVMPPLTLLLDHPQRVERSMNGLKHRTGAPTVFNTLLRPSPTPGHNIISLLVATHGCRRDTVRAGTVATGVPHPSMGDGCSLGTVELHCATRRCRTPPGTASPDAVRQRSDWKSSHPESACGVIPTA